MQLPDAERRTFDDWIRWALSAGSGNVQPPDRVWQCIAASVASLDGESSTPGPVCQQCASAGSKS